MVYIDTPIAYTYSIIILPMVYIAWNSCIAALYAPVTAWTMYTGENMAGAVAAVVRGHCSGMDGAVMP